MMGQMRARVGAIVGVLAVVVLIGSWLQPATAHPGAPGHLWTDHLRARADLRYLQNTKVYVSPQFSIAALSDATVTRLCPSGWQAIGGGVDLATANANVLVISDAPIVGGANLFAAAEGKHPAATGWRVSMHNNGVLDVDGVLGAICTR